MSSTKSPSGGWERIDSEMRVVRLRAPLQLMVPALIFPSLSKATRGLTLFPGRMGLALGALLVVSSAVMGLLLYGPTGPWGGVLSFWLIGTAGVAMLASGLRPIAFVKPICVRCRLLPVIREHEAIHLSGVASERQVWESMKARHSVESLGLKGDPSICTFCPIPKRLSEH
ncbi:MAG TPA: hypothetical protein VEB87_03105 [Nitrososphaerales archaeon]|jgi:hypothetical protein|nr:hypothetical protein [Nitrososphaerales archaeon]